MGNAKSQPCRSRRPLYLFYLIHRTWNVVVEQRSARKEEPYEDTDRETDLTSRCSGCAGCGYHQESLCFESESEMAPNAEEELLAVKPWGPQPDKQERLRPPTYNAEDYAAALRRWGKRPVASSAPKETHNGTLLSTTSSSSGYASGSGEMTLRQFTSVSELLNKLRADLRLAFPSFVQEFASSPADGITLLLETLRGVQVAQNTPPSGQTGPRVGTRRAALDELGCVECLAACGERCADAPRLLMEAQPGLLALAVCLTSSLNRSRVLALQLLTRVCQAPGGHAAVSEAVSTLRLRYGEGGRFRFLAGALLAPSAAIVLRVAGIAFLNAFIKSAPRSQTKLYIQAEACEAGLEPKILQEWLIELDSSVEESLTDLLTKEVNRWTRNCVDVEALQKRAARAEETCRMLGKKILSLQSQIENLQVENMNGYNNSRDCNKKLGVKSQKKMSSSNIDDEGISSSERSSTPDDLKREEIDGSSILKMSSLDNDQETTIDDVIEELRIIVKDAEEEYEDKNMKQQSNTVDSVPPKTKESNKPSKYLQPSNLTSTSCSESIQRCDQNQITYFGNSSALNGGEAEYHFSNSSEATRKLSSNHSSISKSSADGSLKILVKGPDLEDAIVPAILHPQPPKRSPPCLSAILAGRNFAFAPDNGEAYNSPGEEVEEETLGDGSDSLLSASRLKYAQNEPAQARLLESFSTRKVEGKALAKSCDNLCDFKMASSTGNGEKKTIRNYDSGNMAAKSFDSRRSVGINGFQKAHSQSSDQSLQKWGGHKSRSEIEKRKMLRRTSSQDGLESNKSSHQKLKRSESGIESRIRKFESLNSFEDMSLQSLSRPVSVENVFDDNSKGRIMRRSESFHHVSVANRESSSRGGSDSGLFYVTDFDLEPVITQINKPDGQKPGANLLTKSLDRIDEGLDSMVDIVLTEENHWAQGKDVRSKAERKEKRSKSSGKQKRDSKGDNLLKNDEFYSGFSPNGSSNAKQQLLRNDELYNEKQLVVQKQWSYQTELNNSRIKAINPLINADNALPVSSRSSSFCIDKSIASKFSKGSTESGIYLPGVSCDAFGLSKSRFNAGKYSGNNLLPVRDNIGGNRNPVILPPGTARHGKVTDVISGLY